MDFRKRLIVTFMIMTLFPIALLMSLGCIIIEYQESVMQQAYDTEVNTLQALQNPVQVLNRLTRGIYNELRTVTQNEPDSLLDESFLQEMNDRLEKRQAFLVVYKDGGIVFCGNDDIFSKIKDSLPEYGSYNTNVDGGLYVNGRIPYLVKQQDFLFSDGENGSVYIISDVNTLMPQTRTSLIQAIGSVLIVFFITGLLLIVWLYAGLIKPINKLKRATRRVKEGDLNFRLEKTGEDEIGELSEDFEEMRAHLKTEIDTRIQYEEDLRNLIGNISHDLKTPLTTIKGYAEGMLDGVADTPEKQEKYLRTIRSKAEDMTRMVEELSLYTRIDCKSYPYHFEKVHLRDFFSDCIEEDGPELEEKHIKISLDARLPEDDEVYADREQLKRVTMNIIGNAVKYLSKESGKITITLLDEPSYIRTEITDTGAGIPEKDLPHIFERFYRGDSSRNTGKGGSGLGLAIVKQIVEDHGGTIRAVSTEGEGTTISFTLLKVHRDGKEQNAPKAAKYLSGIKE
ncbi:MAG: HAMP domain-containing sensor histidine kinase [Lachnospiraceae bacterium]|nr:HAMP domain-containing sensor histidine kinase [Lachnospiraceae bacterium]